MKNVRLDDAGCVSDHRMVMAQLALGWRRLKPVTFSVHRLKQLNFDFFENSLRNSSLFTNQATSANGFADQRAEVLTLELDKVAPLKTVTCTSTGKRIHRFLSDEAVRAKQERWWLDRCWKRSGKETDRQRYCKSCKETNRLINNSHQHYYADQINNLSQDPRKH